MDSYMCPNVSQAAASYLADPHNAIAKHQNNTCMSKFVWPFEMFCAIAGMNLRRTGPLWVLCAVTPGPAAASERNTIFIDFCRSVVNECGPLLTNSHDTFGNWVFFSFHFSRQTIHHEGLELPVLAAPLHCALPLLASTLLLHINNITIYCNRVDVVE